MRYDKCYVKVTFLVLCHFFTKLNSCESEHKNAVIKWPVLFLIMYKIYTKMNASTFSCVTNCMHQDTNISFFKRFQLPVHRLFTQNIIE